MAQYIDKFAVVSEINRVLDSYDPNEITSGRYALVKLRKFLNTLEVKKVDFEKKFDDYTKDIMACDVQFEPFTHLYNCARHFYELGLKTQKGE